LRLQRDPSVIYGSDQFFIDEDGVRRQQCLCTAKQPGMPFTRLVTVFADEGNNYVVERFDDFDSRLVGQGKDLTVMMYPKGTVVILEERPA
jgi:hypothetical protein